MAVRALLHYALEVPDQTVGEKFYRGFGLVGEGRGDDAVHLRPAPIKRDSVLLYAGPKKRLHHVAFGAPGAEFEATRESIRRAGVAQIDPPRGAPEGGVWVRDPDGNVVNVRPEAGETPPADPPLALNSPGHVSRVAVRAASPRGSRRIRAGWATSCCSPGRSTGRSTSTRACSGSSSRTAATASSRSCAARPTTTTWPC